VAVAHDGKCVAIIGAGFSGTVLAARLLAAVPGIRVCLIGPVMAYGRGLASGVQDDNLLLNVPVGNMSAFPEDPDHFLAYCRGIDPAISPGSFVSRRLYGEYLEWLLGEAESRSPERGLRRVVGKAVALDAGSGGRGYCITMDSGERLQADVAVLAMGHASPAHPAGISPSLSGRVLNPWDFGALDALDPALPVAILGSGHTAIDAAFRLHNQMASRQVCLISRRGLLPHGHRLNPKAPASGGFPHFLEGVAPTALALLRALRTEAAIRAAGGRDWRDLMNEIRPHTHRIWQSLPLSEQKIFLRRLAPYWDVHRHRLAPVAWQRLRRLVDRGQVLPIAGRVVEATDAGAAIRLAVRRRGTQDVLSLTVAAVVNATGPDYDISHSSNDVLRSLLARGEIQQDALRLGLNVDAQLRVIRGDGSVNPSLAYLGPGLKAKYWEAIAVPELRKYAQVLADSIVSALQER
jgi:uncharacterized NAD(P)/FAD-binding protein YdhS